MSSREGQWIFARDEALDRRVWIRPVPPGTPAIAGKRRDACRTGRLRWLTGRRSAEENWDAYEAPDGAPLAVQIARNRTGFRLTTRGASHVARVLPAHAAPHAHHLVEKVPPDLSRFLLCPMPGLLMRLDVAPGDKVEIGQPLAVVEAMKMENILRAEKAGTVKMVSAKPGDSLHVDAVILEIE